MKTLPELFENNKKWAEEKLRSDTDTFEQLAHSQHPDILWIGCSDSRIRPGEVTSLPPGRIFVHRNIANQFDPADPNSMSVIEYALGVLRVKHVVICGHTGCGGTQGALKGVEFDNSGLNNVNKWLEPLRALAFESAHELTNLETLEEKADRLAELNVLSQIKNFKQLEIVRQTAEQGLSIEMHAWMYELKTGLLKDLSLLLDSK